MNSKARGGPGSAGADPGFWFRGAQRSFDLGGLKFAQKYGLLPENCMILNKFLGAWGPGPHWMCK